MNRVHKVSQMYVDTCQEDLRRAKARRSARQRPLNGVSRPGKPQDRESGQEEVENHRTHEEQNLDELTVKELRTLASEKGITGVSRLRKDELVASLIGGGRYVRT